MATENKRQSSALKSKVLFLHLQIKAQLISPKWIREQELDFQYLRGEKKVEFCVSIYVIAVKAVFVT